VNTKLSSKESSTKSQSRRLILWGIVILINLLLCGDIAALVAASIANNPPRTTSAATFSSTPATVLEIDHYFGGSLFSKDEEYGGFDWSPDSQKIVYVAEDGNIYVKELADSNVEDRGQLLTHIIDFPTYWVSSIAWSPNGKTIAFVLCDHDNLLQCRLRLMNADGTDDKDYVDAAETNRGDIEGLCWAADSGLVGYESPGLGNSGRVSALNSDSQHKHYDIDQRTAHQLVTRCLLNVNSADVKSDGRRISKQSPDGKHVAYKLWSGATYMGIHMQSFQ